MAFNIKNEEADELARQLCATTGESLTGAVLVALRERLQREQARRGIGVATRLQRLVADVQQLEVLDDRSSDAILGYDDRGVP